MESKLDYLYKFISNIQSRNIELELEKDLVLDKIEKNSSKIFLEFLDLIDLFELMLNRCDAIRVDLGKESIESRIIQNFRKVLSRYERFLSEHNIFKIQFSENKANAQLCEVIDVYKTNNNELDGSIKDIVKHGYRKDDNVLRYAQVITYKYDDSINSSNKMH